MTTDYAFAVFIITHGRAGHVTTDTVLRRQGFTGQILYVVDDLDPQLPEYQKLYGTDAVKVFSKSKIVKSFDIADTKTDTRSSCYARNAANILAEELKFDYFLVLDDDYVAFKFRYGSKDTLHAILCSNLDNLFAAMLRFLIATNADAVALAQGGDFIGGAKSKMWKDGIKRKAMNSWFLTTKRPVTFLGRLNEDVNAYLAHGAIGKIFLSVTQATIDQKRTQQQAGGMTEAYLDSGTYQKSFYSVLFTPSCVKVQPMFHAFGGTRYHHRITWDHAVPKIINERHRKEDS